jgi:hypothetical protein
MDLYNKYYELQSSCSLVESRLHSSVRTIFNMQSSFDQFDNYLFAKECLQITWNRAEAKALLALYEPPSYGVTVRSNERKLKPERHDTFSTIFRITPGETAGVMTTWLYERTAQRRGYSNKDKSNQMVCKLHVCMNLVNKVWYVWQHASPKQ